MTARPAVDSAAAREILIAALRARQKQPGLILIGLPAPWLALESLWAALPAEPAMLWDPPASRPHPDLDGESCLGIGEVVGYASDFPIERIAPPGHATGSLRWLGARPFAGVVAEPPWTDFPAETTILPRWRYTRGPAGCTWHLTVHSLTDELIAQVAAEFSALTEAGAQSLGNNDLQVPLRSEQLPFARWQEWMRRILQAIDDGLVDKVVAARHTRLVFPQPIEVAAVLGRLRAQAPQATRFAVRRGRATFLGATPELLLHKRGRDVITEALAGTLARTAAPLAALSAQLLGSDKDRREHALVVAAIKQRLAPLCSAIIAPESPQIRALPHLLHLHTPIQATTRELRTDVRELVAALHPTPAVGGTPTATALQLIADFEPQPRGYYAGPIGWWDEHGDGEFAVAIRSAVVAGDTAYVYGGAGIVRGSDPQLEYAETATKMRTLLDALAVPSNDLGSGPDPGLPETPR